MADDRPRGSCLIDGCSRDPYPREDGRLPLVCGPDVSRLRHWLREIPQLVDELSGGGYVMRDSVGERLEKLTEGGGRAPVARYGPPPARLAAKEPGHPLVLRAGQPVEHRDLVANLLPAGPIGGAQRGGRVSGSSEPRLPIAVDAVDLLAPASRRTPAAAVLADLAYPEQDDDQIGFLPVAVLLDQWAEILRDHRDRGEGQPEPSVTVLARWLLDRLDEAVMDWYPIDEFADDLRRAHGALRGQLGKSDVPDLKAGVPCPRCYAQRLVQLAGESLVRCQACPAVLLESEFHEHVKTMARKVNRVKLNKATVSINGGEARPCTLQITTHMVDVSTFSGVTKPDPAWTLVDAAGHFHAWDHEGRLPTLQERTEWVAYAEPDEDTGETGYETSTMHCRLCGVQVEPATVTTHDLGKQVAPGRTEWLIEFDGPAPYECSVVVRGPDKVFFGIANCYERSAGRTTAVGISMSWRKTPKTPEPSVVPAA